MKIPNLLTHWLSSAALLVSLSAFLGSCSTTPTSTPAVQPAASSPLLQVNVTNIGTDHPTSEVSFVTGAIGKQALSSVASGLSVQNISTEYVRDRVNNVVYLQSMFKVTNTSDHIMEGLTFLPVNLDDTDGNPGNNAAAPTIGNTPFVTLKYWDGTDASSQAVNLTLTRGQKLNVATGGVSDHPDATPYVMAIDRSGLTLTPPTGLTGQFYGTGGWQREVSLPMNGSAIVTLGVRLPYSGNVPAAVSYYTVPVETKAATPPSVSATLSTSGGVVQLDQATLEIPAGVLTSDTNVVLTKLSLPPSPVPAPFSTVGVYRLQINTQQLQDNVRLTLPIANNASTNTPVEELYEWSGGKYQKRSIGGEDGKFTVYLNGQDISNNQLDLSFVVVRASESQLSASFATSGGVFNGLYGECPVGMTPYFGSCIVAGMQQNTITPQALVSTIKLFSFNAGNVSPTCADYVSKLCTYTSEQAAIDIIKNANADILLLQEVWNNECGSFASKPDKNLDRVCGPKRKTNRQDQRLVNSLDYDTRCAPLSQGGYECIALRKTKFVFAALSPQAAAFTNPVCEGDNARGKDTGFFVQTVKMLSPLGSVPISFDVLNAHLASPAPTAGQNSNIPCRNLQIYAVINTYKNTNHRLLIGGDFNTEYHGTGTDASALRNLGAPFNAKIDAYPAVRLTYMVDDTTQLTSWNIVANRAYDHVLSNFTDVLNGSPCIRGGRQIGFDHRTTSCKLVGFDTGIAKTGLLVTDTTGSRPQEFVSVIIRAARKGAKIPFATYKTDGSGAYMYEVVLPSSLTFQLDLDMNCIYMPHGYVFATTEPGNSTSAGYASVAGNRMMCP